MKKARAAGATGGTKQHGSSTPPEDTSGGAINIARGSAATRRDRFGNGETGTNSERSRASHAPAQAPGAKAQFQWPHSNRAQGRTT